MAFCGDYKDMNVRRPYGASKIKDPDLMVAVNAHKRPDFWKRFKDEPARHAYVRRWGCVLRREARRRGLL